MHAQEEVWLTTAIVIAVSTLYLQTNEIQQRGETFSHKIKCLPLYGEVQILCISSISLYQPKTTPNVCY